MMKLLTDQEKSDITQAIRQAEQQTSCQLVVIEVAQCDDYKSAQILGGFIFGVLAAIVIYLLHPMNVPKFLVLELAGFLAGFLLLHWIGTLKRPLVPRRKMQDEVHYRAEAEFYQHGLYKTRQENGILIMLAVFERMVVVLGDKGVHSKVPEDYWDKVKDRIISGIKQGQSGRAVIEAITSMAQDFKTHFPQRPDGKNELDDQVITG